MGMIFLAAFTIFHVLRAPLCLGTLWFEKSLSAVAALGLCGLSDFLVMTFHF